MALNLKPAVRSDAQLRAIAASGSSGMAKAAQRELRDRIHQRLRHARAA